MSSTTPRITPQYPPHTQQHSPYQSMLDQRLACIVRARGAESTRRSKKRAQKILVQLDKADDYSRHRRN